MRQPLDVADTSDLSLTDLGFWDDAKASIVPVSEESLETGICERVLEQHAHDLHRHRHDMGTSFHRLHDVKGVSDAGNQNLAIVSIGVHHFDRSGYCVHAVVRDVVHTANKVADECRSCLRCKQSLRNSEDEGHVGLDVFIRKRLDQSDSRLDEGNLNNDIRMPGADLHRFLQHRVVVGCDNFSADFTLGNQFADFKDGLFESLSGFCNECWVGGDAIQNPPLSSLSYFFNITGVYEQLHVLKSTLGAGSWFSKLNCLGIGPCHLSHPIEVHRLHLDTIVAPITGVQPAAVAWIRLSGPDAWTVASNVFKSWPEGDVESHRALFGKYVNGDEGLALPFAEDRSYTGEQAVELSLHGSAVSVRTLVEACLAAGARLAEPGEFTLRAFMNGRIDLTQAEAVRETVDAQTEAQLHLANLSRKGVLRKEFSALRSRILGVLAKVEASVDFSEEIGDLDRPVASAEIEAVCQVLLEWVVTAGWGQVVRNGYRIAILGRPNAGKSSLMNALLKNDRSIVTSTPGTTRDYIEESLEVEGFRVILTDTAGLRASVDPVEAKGIERSREVASKANHAFYMYDCAVGWTAEDDIHIAELDSQDISYTILANKVDIAEHGPGNPISTMTMAGIDDLLADIKHLVESTPVVPFVNLRQLPFVEQAHQSLTECSALLKGDAPDDLLSVLLTDAAMQLGAITGETAAPDMIERIFHDFCIGK